MNRLLDTFKQTAKEVFVIHLIAVPLVLIAAGVFAFWFPDDVLAFLIVTTAISIFSVALGMRLTRKK